MYLIDRTALACLSEICALDEESGSRGAAAQMRSTSPCPLSTQCSPRQNLSKAGLAEGRHKCRAHSFAKPGMFAAASDARDDNPLGSPVEFA